MAQDEPGDAAYLLVSGRLRAYVRDDAGVDRLVREMSRGEVIGEMSMYTGRPRSATVIAVRDSVLVRLDRAQFAALLHGDEVLLLADADQAATIHPVEQACLDALPQRGEAAETLVLLHPADRRSPLGMRRWLQRRPVAAHLNLRPTLDSDMARLARILSRQAVGLVLAAAVRAALPTWACGRRCANAGWRSTWSAAPAWAPSWRPSLPSTATWTQHCRGAPALSRQPHGRLQLAAHHVAHQGACGRAASCASRWRSSPGARPTSWTCGRATSALPATTPKARKCA
jgi:hypothetical protein